MTTTLRVVLDQLVAPTDPDLAMASRELTRALIATAPRGCEVAGIVPAAAEEALATARLEGLARLESSGLGRRELAAALALGLPSGLGAGIVHSPTLFAPLNRHDRVHDHTQTVVTLWDLTPFTHPERLPKATVAWHRAMLKRAERHADAVVVPLHAMADELADRTKLGDRIRVIAGAPPADFAVPTDAVGRRRTLGVPEGAIVVDGSGMSAAELEEMLAALDSLVSDVPVVALDAASDAAGSPGSAIAICGEEAADRAAVLALASVLLAPRATLAFGWRVLEALALGTPVVAADSVINREFVRDGGRVVDGGADALAVSVAGLLASDTDRLRFATLAADRGRGFSWRESGDRVWQLHADL